MINKFKVFNESIDGYGWGSKTSDPNQKVVYINVNHNNSRLLDVSEEPLLKYFFEWLEIYGFTLDVSNPHNYNRNIDRKWGVKISGIIVDKSCTHTQYTIGEGDNLINAIYDYIEKIKGKKLIPDKSSYSAAIYKVSGKSLLVPEDVEDFETAAAAYKYNL